MPITRVRSFAFAGIEAVPVDVEVQISNGLPALLMVGLADKAVAESRERVRAALTAMQLSLPPKRILINLAPADLQKEGSHFDLAIALGLLGAMEVLPADELAGFAAVGELSLDGRVNPVTGVLPAALGASALSLGLICPASQGGEAAWGGELEVLATPDLLSVVNHFRGLQVLSPPRLPGAAEPARGSPGLPDLGDVRGMETAKRALEICAAGGHSLMLVGPPGAGKSMLAGRLPGLLPNLTAAEALEVSAIHSVAGLLRDGRLVTRPPFREPHHSASQAAIVGGGPRAKPGEVSLAHRGVLFLDEMPELPRQSLEALRAPIESGQTTVARAAAHVTYPARFQLVAAMNPCRCGYLGDPGRECSRAPRCGEDYLGKISGPMLDRIDLSVQVQPVAAGEIARLSEGESTETVAARVAVCRARQHERQDGVRNAEAPVDQLALSPAARDLAEQAAARLRLSARGFTRILRVARTIADLEGTVAVERQHVAEALGYRHRLPGR